MTPLQLHRPRRILPASGFKTWLVLATLFLAGIAGSRGDNLEEFAIDDSLEYTPLLRSSDLFSYSAGIVSPNDALSEVDHRDPAIIRRETASDWPPKAQVAVVEYSNGQVRPQNLLWNWQFIHHVTANELALDPDNPTSTKVKRQAAATTTSKSASSATFSALPTPKIVRLTFNTCKAPVANASDVFDVEDPPIAPQLMVYVSNTTANQSPGPDVEGKYQMKVEIDGGWGSLEFEASSDIWVSVTAPSLPDEEVATMWNHDPPWNYELSITTGRPYHNFIDDDFLYLVDTDDSAALFITGNMTSESALYGGINETLTSSELLNTTSYPYIMYAQSLETNPTLPLIRGLHKSYCAVRQLSQAKPSIPDTSITTRGLGAHPKQQFHLRELNRTTSYYGWLARPNNLTSGTLWRPLRFLTKSDGNCRIIYNLPFCSEVAYAVPANPTIFPSTPDLADFYDSAASAWYQNFSYSLQQIACNASSDSRYSLVRTCSHCASSYKNWLCAVTIPRCMDYSSNYTYLAPRSSDRLFWNSTAPGWQEGPYKPVVEGGGVEMPRNKTEGVPRIRNKRIEEVLMPGRYKEVKPCRDLCWSLVQDCPAAMEFGCPGKDTEAGRVSYGDRDEEGDVTCSWLGAVYFLNEGVIGRGAVRWGWWGVGLMVGWAAWVGL